MSLSENANLSPDAIEKRKNEILWDALERALDDVLQDREHKANAILVFKHVQAAFTKRMGRIDPWSTEHKTLEGYVNALDVMILTMEDSDDHSAVNIVISNTGAQP
ncbi:hypothetical protein Nit79A3_1397 [Nitrosomonas sp. Is79A3]|uniref:hypothetical protein n=1 Tax=Nitrosomonas sp. (strain Is79A3) TaxID=261292 RepID=UPI000215CFD6